MVGLPDGVSITSYTWDIPGGSPSSGGGSSISTTFNATGDYTATVCLTFSGGCVADCDFLPVEVGDIPTLTATIMPLDICLNENVVGNATSNLPNTEFNWYFEPPGGFVYGGIGMSSNEGYTYESEWQQPWNVLMVGDNNGCKDTVIIPVNVNPPAAQFSWARTCDPRTGVNFNANEDQGIFADSVAWFVNYDFANPIHVGDDISEADFFYDFGIIDQYYVTLIVGSSFTGCLDSQTYVVDLINALPNADIGPTSICPGQNVSFFDNNENILFWQWSFGDGDTSAILTQATTVNHTYNTSGIYNTYLFIEDITGCFDTLGPVPIYVGGGTAVIDGIFGSCFPPLNTGLLTANSSIFNFGAESADWVVELDGGGVDIVTGSLTAGPYIYNNNGTYVVQVTVYDSIGCSDDTTIILNVGDAVADFVSDVQNICPGDAVTFNNQSLGGNLSYFWDFGDGMGTSTEQDPVYIYVLTGQYDVTLTITDTIGGCFDTETKPVYINAVGTGFDFIGLPPLMANCPPLFVNFVMVPPADINDLDVVHWYFEESNEVPGGPDGQGWYDVILVVEVGGCRDSIYKDDYIFVGGQRGSFTFSPDTICAPDQVLFSQVDVDRTDSIFWDFGGGDVLNVSVSVDNITVTYDVLGVYHPVILLNNADCPAVAVDLGRSIYVSDIIADGKIDRVFLCDEGNIEFSDSSLVLADTATGDYITFLQWDFGDGTTSNISNPVHYYSGIFGEIDITLSLVTDFGCADDTTFTIDIYQTPNGQVHKSYQD